MSTRERIFALDPGHDEILLTILPHDQRCSAAPSVHIRKRGRAKWTMADHSRAIRLRQLGAPPAKTGTFRAIVQRGEVAYLYGLSYTIEAVELDEPPWDRFLDRGFDKFICPGSRRPLVMHLHHGPGTPATDRFSEGSA